MRAWVAPVDDPVPASTDCGEYSSLYVDRPHAYIKLRNGADPETDGLAPPPTRNTSGKHAVGERRNRST